MGGSTGLFAQQVIAVVGGGAGIGRAYCLDLGREGAQILVAGRGPSAAEVADTIRAAGGIAEACIADVRDGRAIVDAARTRFGRIDGLIVNAGILHDRTYAKMSDEEWREVIDVHLEGAHACTRAVWPHMLEQRYGRIMLTGSPAGIHGNFGQANYSAAKAALVGLMRALALEGASRNVFVNMVVPMAATAMSKALLSPELCETLRPEAVSPFVLAMMHPQSRENGAILETGGGWGGLLRWQRSAGRRFAPEACTVAEVMKLWDEVARFDDRADFPSSGLDSLSRAAGPEIAATLQPARPGKA